jgi:hypothetical protein
MKLVPSKVRKILLPSDSSLTPRMNLSEMEVASVASILEDTRAKIAKAADLDLERVKLSVQFASEGDVGHSWGREPTG